MPLPPLEPRPFEDLTLRLVHTLGIVSSNSPSFSPGVPSPTLVPVEVSAPV